MKRRLVILLYALPFFSLLLGSWLQALQSLPVATMAQLVAFLHADDWQITAFLMRVNLPDHALLAFMAFVGTCVIRSPTRLHLRDLGWCFPAISTLSVAAWCLMVPAAVGAILLGGWFSMQTRLLLHIRVHESGSMLIALTPFLLARTFTLLHLCVVAPVTEETFFRGFLQGQVFKRVPSWVAIALTSVVFAFYHLDLANFWGYACLGLVFGVVASCSRSLLPSMLLHGLVNGVFVLAVLMG